MTDDDLKQLRDKYAGYLHGGQHVNTTEHSWRRMMAKELADIIDEALSRGAQCREADGFETTHCVLPKGHEGAHANEGNRIRWVSREVVTLTAERDEARAALAERMTDQQVRDELRDAQKDLNATRAALAKAEQEREQMRKDLHDLTMATRFRP